MTWSWKSNILSFVKAKAPCHPTLSPLWPWRIGPPAVGLNYRNTGPWTGPSLHRYHRTRWPNWSSSSNTSTSWRNRNSTSSKSISTRYCANQKSLGRILTFRLLFTAFLLIFYGVSRGPILLQELRFNRFRCPNADLFLSFCESICGSSGLPTWAVVCSSWNPGGISAKQRIPAWLRNVWGGKKCFSCTNSVIIA